MHKVSQDIWNIAICQFWSEKMKIWLDLSHHENIFYGITSWCRYNTQFTRFMRGQPWPESQRPLLRARSWRQYLLLFTIDDYFSNELINILIFVDENKMMLMFVGVWCLQRSNYSISEMRRWVVRLPHPPIIRPGNVTHSIACWSVDGTKTSTHT